MRRKMLLTLVALPLVAATVAPAQEPGKASGVVVGDRTTMRDAAIEASWSVTNGPWMRLMRPPAIM